MTAWTPAIGKTCRALLVSPRFNGDSFWAYKTSCALFGARYPAPPLGLITLAAMLPAEWELRFIDRNVSDDEQAFDAALDWADLVFSGGMLPQQLDLFALVGRAQKRGCLVVVGGPDVSSSPELYESADFRIIGEAEGCIAEFLAAFGRGEQSGVFTAELFKVDITKSPVPRYDLLHFPDYAEITVQFSRGCPFLCEFCDIIELYGRRPRTKTNAQMLAELNRLYELGYRGAIEFSDDNLIGNKKAVKAFLPVLAGWQKERGYPFDFVSEASLNLADDEELLGMLREANFFAMFVGIESPDPKVLVGAQKKQNTRRDIAANIHRIQEAGIFVVGGFIIGFDDEAEGIGQAMIDLIEAASIPVCMVGLLYALPNTQLTRRLAVEGRLHARHDLAADAKSDQCLAGLNFETLRPRGEVLADYRLVVDHIYHSGVYFDRIRRAVDRLDCTGVNGRLATSSLSRRARQFARFLWTVTVHHPELRGPIWRLIAYILWRKPRAFKAGIVMGMLYAHLGTYARAIVAAMDQQMALLPLASPNEHTGDAAAPWRCSAKASAPQPGAGPA